MLIIEKVHAGKDHKFENELINETSPYLLQHAHNPVNWHAWNEEAFEKAKRENKPILLSIGYATCHWCHVMEHESFEDIEIADIMNQNYVCIKVDREQRPDIDSVYMSVVQGMTGRGGWPMTVWLTPDRTPFYGGTYFPPRDGDRGGHPGFLPLLERLSDLYKNHPEQITTRATQISEQIRNHVQQNQSGDVPSPQVFERAYQESERSFDSRYGGFGFAPKFPRPSGLQFLLHYGNQTKNQKATDMATSTLLSMLRGGIYDQLGGGFHRYSVDERWLVPHFEKMLYDQSQIVLSMLDAWQIKKDEEFKRGVTETLDYVIREMTSPEGGFYSATDADSEGVEGKFFVWTLEEIQSVLKADAAKVFVEYYGVTAEGNFEEKNILVIEESISTFAKRKGLDEAKTKASIEESKKILYQVRSKRIPPLTDDKIITSWNGLMIAAFARAGFVLEMPQYIEAASSAAKFVLKSLVQNAELYRSARNGKTNTKAFLDDYACLTFGLLELFEVTGDVAWFKHASDFQTQLIQKFWDVGQGGFFASSENTLFVREKPFYDGAEPSGNSIAAWNLLRFSSFLQDESYREYAEKIFQTFSQTIQSNPSYLPQMLVSLDYFHAQGREIVMVDPTENILKVMRDTYVPNRILIQAKSNDPKLAEQLPLIKDKLGAGISAVYVCQGYICQAPARDAETFQKQLTA